MSSLLPYVAQFRNGLLCHYKDVSFLDINRNGCISTLKQNQKSNYYDALKQLMKKEITTDINEFAASVVNLKKLHNNQLSEQLIISKVENDLEFADKDSEYYKKSFKQKYKLYSEDRLQPTPVGQVSKQQVKSIRKYLENMVNYIYINFNKKIDYREQQYATFLTLTLPSTQVHTDKVIRKLLIRFIDNLRKNYQVKFYVWKAETQGNGNIHFHLLIDRHIDYMKLRNLWNNLLRPLGYIERYADNQNKRGFLYREFIIKNKKRIKNPKSKAEQYRNFIKAKNNGFNNPNTTDIKSLKNIGSPVAYMLKYMTKNEPTKRAIIGKIWGASNDVKKLDYFKIDDTNPKYYEFWSKISKTDLKKIEVNDYLTLFTGKIFALIQKKFKKLWLDIKNHYNSYNCSQWSPNEIIKDETPIKEPPKIQIPIQLSFF